MNNYLKRDARLLQELSLRFNFCPFDTVDVGPNVKVTRFPHGVIAYEEDQRPGCITVIRQDGTTEQIRLSSGRVVWTVGNIFLNPSWS